MGFLRHVAAFAWKDVRVELRSGEVINTMLFFAAIVVLIFSFAFVKDGKAVGDVSTGILWIAVLFAGTLGLSRAFGRERESDTMRGLLLSPAPRGALLLGKAISIFVLVFLTEVVVVPMVAFLFGARLFQHPAPMLLTLVLATAGFAVVGSVFASMLLRVRSRDALLPVVLYPILVPLMIAAVNATAALVQEPALLAGVPQMVQSVIDEGRLAPPADGLSAAWFWIKFLAVFDAIFVTVALSFFESLVIE